MFGRGAERFVDIVQVFLGVLQCCIVAIQFWSLRWIRYHYRRRASALSQPLFPEPPLLNILLFDQSHFLCV